MSFRSALLSEAYSTDDGRFLGVVYWLSPDVFMEVTNEFILDSGSLRDVGAKIGARLWEEAVDYICDPTRWRLAEEVV